VERIRLYLSTEHPCGYLPQRTARSLFVDPDFTLNPARYELLLHQGFRRGGDHVYRPRCAGCAACIPARIPVKLFEPNRSQRRCLKHNADLALNIKRELTDEQFELYQRYLRGRHAGGGMNPEDKPGFHNFLDCGWGTAEFWEFRLDSALLGCAVVDRTPQALSAVYTFFDPDMTERSLGTYAVLQQVMAARDLGMDHVYLGYWVPGSKKMEYKRVFKPLEILAGRGWQTLEA
jgi:arginyl-tRNA--protein-N-Asp/Glu arginylyltransferase